MSTSALVYLVERLEAAMRRVGEMAISIALPPGSSVLFAARPIIPCEICQGRIYLDKFPIRNSASPQRSVLRIGMNARGSALLLVLFAIVLLSGLIITTVGFVKNDIDEYAARNKEFRSRQLAESGLAFGLNPQIENEDRNLLEQRAPDGGMFRVVISSESTKLNINYLLRSNRDDILEKLFMRWGVASKLASEGRCFEISLRSGRRAP
jgi:hypothetical protein